MDLLNQQISFSFSTASIVLIGVGALLVIGIIIFLAIKLRKTQNALKPKYGFLGKSLYAVMTVVVLGGGLVIGVLSVMNNDKVFEVQAKKNLQADIVVNELLEENGYTYISFKLDPIIEGVIWGKETDRITIYWTFSGENGETYSFLEQDKSSADKSGLQKYIKNGNYKITVNVVYETNTYSFTKDASF